MCQILSFSETKYILPVLGLSRADGRRRREDGREPSVRRASAGCGGPGCVCQGRAARATNHRSQRSLARHAVPADTRAGGAERARGESRWPRRRTARAARLQQATVRGANGVRVGGGPRESHAAAQVGPQAYCRLRGIGPSKADTRRSECEYRNNPHATCRTDPRARSEHL